MTTTTTAFPEKLLALAVSAQADVLDAEGPKARAVAAARVRGIAEAADRLDLIRTPLVLLAALADAGHAYGPRPAATASNQPRRDWTRSVSLHVRATLADVL